MTYYEDEILHELTIGQQYSEKQLRIFLVENTDATVISKSCSQFNEYSKLTHKVLNIIKGYEHKGDNGGTYHIPSKQFKIYIVE